MALRCRRRRRSSLLLLLLPLGVVVALCVHDGDGAEAPAACATFDKRICAGHGTCSSSSNNHSFSSNNDSMAGMKVASGVCICETGYADENDWLIINGE